MVNATYMSSVRVLYKVSQLVTCTALHSRKIVPEGKLDVMGKKTRPERFDKKYLSHKRSRC